MFELCSEVFQATQERLDTISSGPTSFGTFLTFHPWHALPHVRFGKHKLIVQRGMISSCQYRRMLLMLMLMLLIMMMRAEEEEEEEEEEGAGDSG